MRKTVFTLLITVLAASAFPAEGGLTYEDQVFDFGHVGIDFNLFHTYTYVNHTDQQVRIIEVDVNCDCSTVSQTDSLVLPGDTARFTLTFNTRDYYGPTNKSFRVVTDDPNNPELKYFYMSTIGQWFFGLKPKPISLFFLPGKKAATITIPNPKTDKIQLAELVKADETFDVTIADESAKKGKALQLEVKPVDTLGRGNYLTTLTISIEVDGQEKLTHLTIPIKIVRY